MQYTLIDLKLEPIPKEIKKAIGNKNITRNIFRIQTYDSVICGYCCTGLVDSRQNSKALWDYTNVFSSNEYEKNDKIILNYFK